MEWYDCADSDEMVVLAATISITLAKELTTNEINSLGNFIQMIGQNLEFIASQRVLKQNKCPCEQTQTRNISDLQN